MRRLLAASILCAPVPAAQAQDADALLDWSQLAPLPDAHGLAGAYAGVSGGALLVAGGANFPGGRPWDGHAKVWHDRVYALDEPDGVWRELDERLPRPLAYGAALTWNDAVVCVGGGDASEHVASAFLLRWDGARLVLEELPELPEPTAFGSAALAGDVVYALGGIPAPEATRASALFARLDLSREPGARAWERLPPLPAGGRMLSVAAAAGGRAYCFGGVQLEAAEDGSARRVSPYLADAWRYDGERWERLADLPRPVAAAPSPAPLLGAGHLLLYPGDDGTRGGSALGDAHPGFAPELHAYELARDRWIEAGRLPVEPGPDPAARPELGTWAPVTTPVVEWRGRHVLPSGEARPGVRTPRVLAATPRAPAGGLGAVDATVLALYLAGVVLVGLYFARREHSTRDFFLAGRRVPWWAAALSIFGTQLSAITFMAVPAIVFATDWTRFAGSVTLLPVLLVVIAFYVPAFRRFELTTAFEVLEERFSVGLRTVASAVFIAFQLARMGIVLLLPAIALAAVTGLGVLECIALMGVLATVYTTLGGISAVIWTDVVQVLVLLCGALVCLVYAVAGAGGPLASFELAHAAGKLEVFRWSWDPRGTSAWVMIVGTFFLSMVPYTSDQTVVQRYLTTRDARATARSLWLNFFMTLPTGLLFFGLGTALWTYYEAHPAERVWLPAQGDQLVPWFVVLHLPAGLAGLVVAGIFAAAMSSLDSSMNSISTAVVNDFVERFRGPGEERARLRTARVLTVLLGALGTGLASWMALADVGHLFDFFQAVLGLFGGALAGVFALAVLTRRVGTAGAWAGLVTGVAATAFCAQATSISLFLYAAVGTLGCVLAGLVVGLLVRPAAR